MYDLILKGGTVVDGSRGEPFVADVAVKDGRIAAISKAGINGAKQVIDVTGKILSPGFIDIHSHSERGGAYLNFTPLNKILQGVTTEIGGNCGWSPCPVNDKYYEDVKARCACAQSGIAEYRDYVTEHGHVTNLGILIGHSNIRICVVDYSARVPSKEEMKAMEDLMEREMKDGAMGISLGLVYPPSGFGKIDEIVNLAKVVKRYNGVLAVHMRSENEHVFEAIEEMIEVAEKSGVRLEISHLKLMGEAQWGMADKAIKLIEDAQARGVDVFADQYPFTAACTGLSVVVPEWAHEGGWPEMKKRLENAGDDIKEGIVKELNQWGGAAGTLINSAKDHPEYQAKYVSDLSKQFGLSVADTVIKLITDTENKCNASFFCMSEEDILKIMKKMYIAVGTDAWVCKYAKTPGSIIAHPRSFNTYTQFFQTVREHNLMPLEDAVYKCTALPADIMHVKDRGLIKEGYFADLVVFDKDKIRNASDYVESRVKPVGIDYVIVNGKIAVHDNELLDGNAGVFIKPEK